MLLYTNDLFFKGSPNEDCVPFQGSYTKNKKYLIPSGIRYIVPNTEFCVTMLLIHYVDDYG